MLATKLPARLAFASSLPDLEFPMVLRTLGVGVAVVLVVSEGARASDVVDLAASLIGRPYVWGAEGPNAFDCSGLTLFVFREFDVDLPRRAVSQSKVGDPTGSSLQRGDLVFFSSDSRRSLVTHVGIYESAGRIIEASKRYGRVRRSSLNDAYWVERFMFARRIVDVDDPRVARAPRDGRGEVPGQTRKGAVGRAAIRAMEDLAGILLRRPR